ncbi:YczI family protein [Desertibacillus haloalkaliphilus]|uniref:YczI family protein n=1 Tax=Desertibacillus haloalkaliphilus TaxID=1328930 RepID=UPI001C279CEC|nr:YczI family protein [Desertibacillus haloalkaliphilus]MBU8907519.1 YczI family protein [Desertibacillus haloalkaliphilus]
MKILRVILAMIVVILSAYSLITGEYGIMPYTQLLLGLMLFVIGIVEIEGKRKGTAFISFISSGFVLVVSINILLTGLVN